MVSGNRLRMEFYIREKFEEGKLWFNGKDQLHHVKVNNGKIAEEWKGGMTLDPSRLFLVC